MHPQPTAAPLLQRSETARESKIRVRQKEGKDPAVHDDDDDSIVLGPFEARSDQDVQALRREIGLDSEMVQKGEAAANARAWMARKMQGNSAMLKRQTSAEQRCFVGNSRLSCYPTNGMQFKQGTWGKFIWNTNYPEFTNNGGFVDIYLFHQDRDSIATTWSNVPNAQGRVSFQPGDSWWQGTEAADNYNGTEIAWPFYFVITYAGRGLDGPTARQSTWYGVQTALPVEIANSRSSSMASLSSASLASAAEAASRSAATLTGSAALALSSSRASASASFAASLTSALVSSLTAQGLHGTETLQSTATGTLSDGLVVTATATGVADGHILLPQQPDSGMPTYSVALIVVFVLLTFIGVLVGIYYVLAAARKRRRTDQYSSEGSLNNEEKTGSAAPMIGNNGREGAFTDEPGSPSIAGGRQGRDEAGLMSSTAARSSSVDRHTHDGPFDSNEASRMAHAFRAALREPSFGEDDRIAENSHRQSTLSITGANPSPMTHAAQLMREELIADGQDLQRVPERRRPEVHD